MTDDERGSKRRNDPTRVLARRTLAWILDVLLFDAAFLATIVVFGQRFTGTAIAAEPAGFRFESGDATLWFPKDVPGLGDSVLVVPGDKFWLAVALFWVVLLLDWVLVQGLSGVTFGKALTGVRCVTRTRHKPGIGRALLRTLLWVIDLIQIVLPLGFILATFTKGHRRVGDMAAGTFVVDRRFAARLRDAAEDGRSERIPADEVHLDGLETTDDERPFADLAGDAGDPSVFAPGAGAAAATAAAASADGPAGRPGAPAEPAIVSRPTPETAPARAPERSTDPVWNDDLGTYIRWEPSVERWIGWDEANQKWRAIDPSRLP